MKLYTNKTNLVKIKEPQIRLNILLNKALVCSI